MIDKAVYKYVVYKLYIFIHFLPFGSNGIFTYLVHSEKTKPGQYGYEAAMEKEKCESDSFTVTAVDDKLRAVRYE